MGDALRYATDAAARYAAADDWIMARAMFATAERLRRDIALATTREVFSWTR